MNTDTKVYQLSLQSFTEIIAVISHELKNTLAIINENNGLLEDLVMLSGESIESERVKKVNEKIDLQVKRSDLIIKTTSRFAHLTDKVVSTEPVHQILADIIKLTERKAAGSQLAVEFDCDETIAITGELPVIAACLYNILAAIYATATNGENKKLILLVNPAGNTIKISFIAENFSFDIPARRQQNLEVLTTYLGGELNTEGVYSVSLPQ